MKNIFLGFILLTMAGAVEAGSSGQSGSVASLRTRCEVGIVRAEESYNNGESSDEEGFLNLSR